MSYSDFSSDDETSKTQSSLLSVIDIIDPKRNSNGKAAIKTLKKKANVKRTRGELFATDEQIGHEALPIDIANLNQAMNLKSHNNVEDDDEDFIQFNNSDDSDQEEGSFNITDLFAMHAKNDKAATKTSSIPVSNTTQAAPAKLTVSSLLSSLQKSSSSSSNKFTPGSASLTGGASLQQQLLSTLQKASIHKLEQSISQIESKHQTATAAPTLSHVEKARLERKTNYELKNTKISEYDGIVQHQSQSDQINYARQDKAIARTNNQTSQSLAKTFNPTTDLEHELNDLLQRIGVDNEKAQQLEKQRQLLALQRHDSKEEYLEKQRHLAQMKLMAYYETQRQTRIAKIKSRAQRRYLRRQKEKLKEQELLDDSGKLRTDIDPEELQRLEEEYERTRVRERALLKHKGMGDWAKRQQRVANVNQNARRLLQEQVNLGNALRKKLGHKDEGSDDFASESEADDDAEQRILTEEVTKMADEYKDVDYRMKQLSKAAGGDDESVKGSGLFHLPFMQRASEAQRLQNEEALHSLRDELHRNAGDSSDEEGGRRSAAQLSTKLQSSALTSSKLGKKSFAPQTSQNGTAAAAAVDTANDSATFVDAKVVQGAAKPKIADKLLSGGLFDVNFDELDSDTESSTPQTVVGSVSHATNIHEQAQQRQRVLESMRAAQQFRQDNGLDSTNFVPPEERVVKSTSRSDAATIATAAAAAAAAASSDPSQDATETSNDKHPDAVVADDDLDEKAPSLDDILAMSDSDDIEQSAWLQPKPAEKGSKSTSKKQQQTKRDDSQVMVNMQQDSLLLNENRAEQNQQISNRQRRGEKDIDSELLDINLASKKKQGKVAGSEMDLVSLAFSTASAVDEDEQFQQQKAREMEHDLPQEDEFVTGVPGWGSWAGVEKSKAQLAKEAKIRSDHKADIQAQRAAIMSARSDAHLKNVILTQRSDTKALKYQTHHVPYPYRSIDEYQRAMSTPLGKEWNSHKSFIDLNKKKVIINPGQVVKPMTWKAEYATYTKDGDKVETVEEAEKINKRKATQQKQKIAAKKQRK